MSDFKATPSNKRAFHNLMEQGKTPAEIAEIYGVTEFAVVVTLRNASPKIEGVNYSHLKLPIPLDEVHEAFMSGGLEGVAEKYGVSEGMLRLRLREAGLVGKHQRLGKPQHLALSEEAMKEEIKTLYAEGLTMAEVGERIGKSTSFVRDKLTELGVARRSKGRTKGKEAPKAGGKSEKKVVFMTRVLDMVVEGKFSAEVAKELNALFDDLV